MSAEVGATTLVPDTAQTTGSDYATLVRTVRAAGLLRRRPLSYGVRGLVTIGFYGACWLSIVWVGSSWLQLINAAALAIAYGQIAFLGHDAGHQAIFGTRRSNDLLGRSLANLLTGLRTALRHAQPIVRAHCRQLGLPYTETSLVGSYRAVLAHLHAIGAPLRGRIPVAE